jgi:hypothetical protein
VTEPVPLLQPPTRPDINAELAILRGIVSKLEPLDTWTRDRILRWLMSRYPTDPF